MLTLIGVTLSLALLPGRGIAAPWPAHPTCDSTANTVKQLSDATQHTGPQEPRRKSK